MDLYFLCTRRGCVNAAILRAGFLLLSTSILAKYNFQFQLPKKYFRMMRIITMALDCYHYLLCTNTKSRDCTIIVRCLYNPTEEKSSIHLCPLLICSECTIKGIVLDTNFQKLSLSQEAFCYPPAPFPATPNHDLAAFKNEDTPGTKKLDMSSLLLRRTVTWF